MNTDIIIIEEEEVFNSQEHELMETEEDEPIEDEPITPPVTTVGETDYSYDILQELQDANDYWELFLDSYTITVPHFLTGTQSTNLGWKFSASGGVSSSSSTYDKFTSFPVTSGVTYTISNGELTNGSSTSDMRVGVVDNLSFPTSVTNFRLISVSDVGTSYTITPTQDGYLVYYSNPRVFSGHMTWNTCEQESYTLSEIGNAIMDTQERVTQCYTLLNFSLVITLFVFILNIVRKQGRFFNRKGDL